MAECCEVMVAHGPPKPLFTAAGRRAAQPELVFYQNLRLVVAQKQSSPMAARRYNGGSRASAPSSPTTEECGRQACQPRRPCLVVRADSDGSIGSSSSGSSSDENELASPTRRKKKVVFADDRGLSLTQVRLMNEPSNQPPKLMTANTYLNQPSTAPASPSKSADGRWRLRFSQPASSYVDFRRRLDTGNVSLENVIVRWPDRRIVGTVKVRNVSYDKMVFVRCTDDGWVTHQDTECTYVRNNAMTGTGGAARDRGTNPSGIGCPAPSAGGVTAIYDTFSFRMPLPAHSPSMEFAVCYKGDGFECWDNNSGDNYRLSADDSPPAASLSSSPALASADALPPSPPPLSADDSDRQTSPPVVHYFGAQSRQNSWTAWRDQITDTSAYW